MTNRKYHNGNELFHNDQQQQDFCVSDFWHFAFGDLLDNTYRGHLAEFILSKALDLDTTEPRADWSEYDLLYRNFRIEVKSSAYLQSWNLNNDKYSHIQFSIAPARRYEADCGGYIGEKTRHSDFYVFCLYEEKDKQNYDILDLSKWSFYLLPTAVIEQACGSQRTISFSMLKKLNAVKCSYKNIKLAIDRIIEENK